MPTLSALHAHLTIYGDAERREWDTCAAIYDEYLRIERRYLGLQEGR